MSVCISTPYTNCPPSWRLEGHLALAASLAATMGIFSKTQPLRDTNRQGDVVRMLSGRPVREVEALERFLQEQQQAVTAKLTGKVAGSAQQLCDPAEPQQLCDPAEPELRLPLGIDGANNHDNNDNGGGGGGGAPNGGGGASHTGARGPTGSEYPPVSAAALPGEPLGIGRTGLPRALQLWWASNRGRGHI